MTDYKRINSVNAVGLMNCEFYVTYIRYKGTSANVSVGIHVFESVSESVSQFTDTLISEPPLYLVCTNNMTCQKDEKFFVPKWSEFTFCKILTNTNVTLFSVHK